MAVLGKNSTVKYLILFNFPTYENFYVTWPRFSAATVLALATKRNKGTLSLAYTASTPFKNGLGGDLSCEPKFRRSKNAKICVTGV